MFKNLQEITNNPQVQQAWSGLTKNHKHNVNPLERLISLLGGGLVAIVGLSRGSLGGLLSALVGGYMIYRGLTGYCRIYDALDINTARSFKLKFDEHTPEHPDTTVDDKTDETVWQTFPASDAPSTW